AGLQRVVGDLPLRLEGAQALVQGQPAGLRPHLDDHRCRRPLDEPDRVVLARQDADAPVAFQVGVDADVALPPFPGRLGHGDLLTSYRGTARTAPEGAAALRATCPA